MFEKDIQSLQQSLAQHSLYQSLDSIDKLKIFMVYDCLALWTSMTLLKSLQQRVTCIYLPWYPSPHSPEVVRFVNELVLFEESDLDDTGHAMSHFETYYFIMKGMKTDTSALDSFLSTGEFESLPLGAQAYVKHLVELAFNGTDEEVAASLFLAREKILPRLYTQLKNALLKNGLRCQNLDNLLQRQIEVGSARHAPFAQVCFDLICDNDKHKKIRAMRSAKTTLELQLLLWNSAQRAVEENEAQIRLKSLA